MLNALLNLFGILKLLKYFFLFKVEILRNAIWYIEALESILLSSKVCTIEVEIPRGRIGLNYLSKFV